MTPSILTRDALLRAGVRAGLALRAAAVHRSSARDDRGDVPGWVMITVMTAGLVAMLTAVAGPQLRSMLDAARASVSG